MPTGGVVAARRALAGGIVLPAAPIGRFASMGVCVVFGGGAVPPVRRMPGRYATSGCAVARFSRAAGAATGAGGVGVDCEVGGCEPALRLRPGIVAGGGLVD